MDVQGTSIMFIYICIHIYIYIYIYVCIYVGFKVLEIYDVGSRFGILDNYKLLSIVCIAQCERPKSPNIVNT